MTLGDPFQPEVPPRCRAPRRVPWSVLVALSLVAAGSVLCVAGQREAGMLLLGAAVGHFGPRAASTAVKGQ